MSDDVWSVALPEGAKPPFQVWVNGEPREEGSDYAVEGRWLRFSSPLRPKVRRRGLGGRMVMLAGIGVYGDQKADVVDLRYHVGGHVKHATELPIIPPAPGDPS
ncbi:MAG: hypothetical protein ACPHP1_06360 [Miltoncostaeaceae bacterium]